MLTEIYMEALLVDEELADLVWEALDCGGIDDQVAWLAWWLIGNLMAQRAFSRLDLLSLIHRSESIANGSVLTILRRA